MKRYCPNCKKEFDFTIKSMSDLDNLVCPECHRYIDRNSRKPVDSSDGGKTEAAIGTAFVSLLNIAYIFYATVSLIGIVAFFMKWDMPLYITTGICLGVFLILMVTGFPTFMTGFIFLPIGGVFGFLIFKSIRGACFGVLVVFLIRHLLRELFFGLMGKLANMGRK